MPSAMNVSQIDPELDPLIEARAYAQALRKSSDQGVADKAKGSMVGPYWVRDDDRGDLLKSATGAGLDYWGGTKQQELIGQRQQAEQDMFAQMPTAEKSVPQWTEAQMNFEEGAPDEMAGSKMIQRTPQEMIQANQEWANKFAPTSQMGNLLKQSIASTAMADPYRRETREDAQAARKEEQVIRAESALVLSREKAAALQAQREQDRSLKMTLAQMAQSGRGANIDLDRQLKEMRIEEMKSKATQGTAAQQKVKQAQTEKQRTLDEALANIDIITKPGGPLEKATASGAGAAYDKAAAFFGQGTEGAVNAAKIAPLADPILKMVPRFEGPQSDKDTASYKEAAGQLADASLPRNVRQAAAKTIKEIMVRRKSQFSVAGMENTPDVPTGEEPEASKVVGGITYVKRGGKWYPQ